MNRRGFLALASAMAGAAFVSPAMAHTPYGQWVVYRQKHLLIGAHRGDGTTYDLARLVVAGLDRELPTANARVARGPRPQRIASLMTTGQLSLAVLSADEADRMARAVSPFDGFRPTPIRTLADLGEGYLLFATEDFPADHGTLVAEALDHAGLGRAPEMADIGRHPGAETYWIRKTWQQRAAPPNVPWGVQ
jgi:uncharacterized protein (DUF3820 family)